MNEVREVDVEQIMRRIRENVRQKRGAEALPPRDTRASPFDDGQGAVDFAHLGSSYDIKHVPLSSHRSLVGPLVVAIKKALRMLLTPILDRQVAYNAANVRVTAHLREWIEALDGQYALIRGQIEILERSRAEAQLEVRELESRLTSARLELRQEILAAQSQAFEAMRAELRAEARSRSDD
jgi:hypothetical protein